jgi:hypothetical protein
MKGISAGMIVVRLIDSASLFIIVVIIIKLNIIHPPQIKNNSLLGINKLIYKNIFRYNILQIEI